MGFFPSDRPPIAWSIRERLRTIGGASVGMTAILIALELLVADIQGGQPFSRYTPGGNVSLWPSVRMIVVALPVAGVVAACILPLYRYRYGGIAVGGLVVLAFIAATIGVAGAANMDLRSVVGWQRMTGILVVVLLGATMGSEMSATVLGRADATSSENPPVT